MCKALQIGCTGHVRFLTNDAAFRQRGAHHLKKSKHYRQYINVGRDIATAKKPITAGPEIKYIKKKGEKTLYIQHSALMLGRLETEQPQIS